MDEQKNDKSFPTIEKETNVMQNDRLNLQKVHQIARLISPEDRLTKYAIPGMVKWLKTAELMEKMK
jgi:hypothetical protein